jgi:hypothetical protein
MKFKLSLGLLLLVNGLGFGQVTIFNESVGNCCSTTNTAITSTTFDNSSLTFSGSADTRTSIESTGYTGASGDRNVYLTNNGSSNFQIASINTTTYSNLILSFGAHKSTNASNMSELLLEYSIDGVTFLPLSFPAQPTGTGTSNWRLIFGISLPFTTEGVSNLRLRWTNTSSGSGTPQLRIDDIILQGELVTTPAITLSPSNIIGLDHIVGNGPSAEQSFTVSGSNLTNDITLTAPANFEISTTSGISFGNIINLPQIGGNVANTTIYTRLIAGLPNGNYNGNITATSAGATNQNVVVEGTVIADVVITEIMFDTTGTDDEWIEICNFSGAPQDISNYIVNVNSGSHTFTFPAGVIIANNDCITVSLGSDGDGTFNNGGCPFVPDFGIAANINNSNNLPNSAATYNISLFSANGSSLADTVDYTGRDNTFVNISLHVAISE